jgi:predicted RNase H-like HicB family nuclease
LLDDVVGSWKIERLGIYAKDSGPFRVGGGIEMKEYAAVFEKTSNGWSAYAPDLPGLGVAAATFEETEQLLREGIEFHIEGLREDGLPIPEPSTQVMRLAIPA